MNPQHELQLEDAQKKLALFRKHLELIARCTGESKNVHKDEILSAVAELQSLVEWAAQQPDLGAESAILLVKLQELNQIRENLEKTSPESHKTTIPETNNDEQIAISNKTECLRNDFVCSNIVTTSSNNNCGENAVEDESASIDKDSLFDYSVSTEDRSIANADSPESIEDTNVEIIPNDDKTDEGNNIEKDNVQTTNDADKNINNENSLLVVSEALKVQEEQIVEGLDFQSRLSELKSPDLYRSEVIIIETDEDNKPVEWLNDPKNSNDPLDVCMYAIRNLYESLRVKENELLKLSAMQSDQKQIEALQAVIIDFHKDITNLNSELEHSKKENMLLKEQVLELEEAENDARLVAQKLEQKLIFLQEKDSHSQAELSQLKLNLKKNAEIVAEKERIEKELRSQIKYMETLVQKYEDQIKAMEVKEMEASQKAEKNLDPQTKCDTEIQVKPETFNKGTQMYIFPQSKIQRSSTNKTDANNQSNDVHDDKFIEISTDSKSELCETEDNVDTNICSIDLTSVDASALCSEQAGTVNFENTENTSQKGLLKRLHKLIDEDVNLQQQIHYVDEINLAMWKKLQNLDNHIGECKRQNINETNPIFAETELESTNLEKLKIETQMVDTINKDKNIPEGSLNNCEQNKCYVQERLNKLKEINASLEKQLEVRQSLYKESGEKCEEWMEIENQVIKDINVLAEEKKWIKNQITIFKDEAQNLENLIFQLEQGMKALKNKNQEELSEIRVHQETMIGPLILKINQMLIKEKDILKMISNFKLKENRSQARNELERLKCNYIELQLELSQAREEIRKFEEKFKYLQDKCAERHVLEETQLSKKLECVRNENIRCNKIINDLQENKKDLMNALQKQESYLHKVRETYQKNVEKSEEEQHFVETELESQIRLIEEEAAIATTVLKEERLKAEKEIQENIKDLKVKEEVYKNKIAALQRDVINLHEELNKISSDTEEKKDDVQLQEKIPDDIIEKSIEILSSKSEMLEVASSKLPRSATNVQLKSPTQSVKEKALQIAKNDNSNDNQIRPIKAERKDPEEDVDELRAQVRELQSHIEKISEKVSELPDLPDIQPAKSITASSLNMQREDMDYAEVDECCSVSLKKENVSNLKESDHKHKNFYESKYAAGYKNAFKSQEEDSLEENDYDEVLPRPTNFHVVQQVGADTLLVGWNYVNPSVLEGFEIYVDDQVHDRIYIPDRTKALISGLNLRNHVRLSIYALSRYGQPSEPTILEISPQLDLHTNLFDDEEDEYRDFEDPTKGNKRPYSMEW